MSSEACDLVVNEKAETEKPSTDAKNIASIDAPKDIDVSPKKDIDDCAVGITAVERKKHKKEKKSKKSKKEKHKKHKHKHKKHNKNVRDAELTVPLKLASKRLDLDKLTDLQDLEKAKAFLQVSYTFITGFCIYNFL